MRVWVGLKDGFADAAGNGIRSDIADFLEYTVGEVRTAKVYLVEGPAALENFVHGLFADPVIETEDEKQTLDFDWVVEVSYKRGVTDNVGASSRLALSKLSGVAEDGIKVSYVRQYLLKAKLAREDVEGMALQLLVNPLIEDFEVFRPSEGRRTGVQPRAAPSVAKPPAEYVQLGDEKDLVMLSEERLLALDIREMSALKQYFERPEVVAQRKKVGMEKHPTDVEIEAIAQTWSEHCKHKIFNAKINYSDASSKRVVNSLFRQFIQKSTEEIIAGKKWVLSVFKDNAGVISFNDEYNLAYKVETHNSPSALDPYGGAITGILGVIRDSHGTGRGAKPLIDTWGYCFGDPFSKAAPPKGLLHPRRIREGVHRGVKDGGNQMGIPYGRGFELFDARYGGKPLVFCGNVAVLPRLVLGEPSENKQAYPGDLVVMVGGRVGKDGIHGATFSSLSLKDSSPAQAVQIGDAYTQKRMVDFLLEARDLGLYKCITDNGAGGLSSSVGEMAEMSGGCEIDLDKVPLKYPGLAPWEILVSESQERMTVSVAPEKIEEFLSLSKRRDVESSVIGVFNDSGSFRVDCGGRPVAFLDMDFFHKGVPQMELDAVWVPPNVKDPVYSGNLGEGLYKVLARLNVCSKEYKCRQYDHEVKGLTVVKPFVGINQDCPSDATVFLVECGGLEGIVLSEGINPYFSDIDTYHMAASCVDEAARRIVSVGGRLDRIAALDNFCWPDPVKSDRTPDGEFKLAQLVRANMALYDYTTAYGIPLISGKDSMKNDSTRGGVKISIPPTLLFSAIGRIDDVSKAVTPDFKDAGDLVYVAGTTYDELGGSEYFRMASELAGQPGCIGSKVPKVDAKKAIALYQSLSNAIADGLVKSSHALSKGGLGVGLVESAMGGDLGVDVDLGKVLYEGEKRDELVLFSESNSRFILTVSPANREKFERSIGSSCSLIGKVTKDKSVKITGFDGRLVVSETLSSLVGSYKRTLGRA